MLHRALYTRIRPVGFMALFLGLACTPEDQAAAPDAGPVIEPSFCAQGGAIEATEDNAWRVESAHYVLIAYTDRAEALVLSAMLEAQWSALSAWFDAVPQRPENDLMRVEFYADRDAFRAALERDEIEAPSGAGGYYHTRTDTAYMYQQPTRYYTRQLMLHEAIHQFHHGVRLAGHSVPSWYTEGHAEHLSLYDWDDRCLRLGRLPLLTQKDLPAQMLGRTIDLAEHIDGSSPMHRPTVWAIFRFFETAQGGEWAEPWASFRRAMDAGANDGTMAFQEAFGVAPDSFNEAFNAWLPQAQEPMTADYAQWSHVGPESLDGWSQWFSTARVKGQVETFRLRFTPPATGSWAGGVLLSFRDEANWIGLVVTHEGRLSTFEKRAGEAVWWDQGEAPPADQGVYRFALRHQGDITRITINDAVLELPLVFEPAGGAALNASTLRFEGIQWQ